MNANEFIKALKNTITIKDDKMSAKDFFETEAGKKMINYISREIQFVGDTSFVVTSSRISIIMNNPLYRGRDFYKDMEELGFSYECVGRYRDIIVISTFLFKIN